MTHPESTPESTFTQKERQLSDALAGRDPLFVFETGGEFGFDGLAAWKAFEHPDKFALHRWSTDEGDKEELFGTRIIDGDPCRGYSLDFFTVGNGQPASFMCPARPELKYRGLVSREDALDIALRWLETYDGKQISPVQDDLDDIAGILDTPNGSVFVTGVGALIFGEHIRAMQQQGVADYFPLHVKLDD